MSSYPTDWAYGSIGDIAEVVSGYAFPSSDFHDKQSEGIPVIRMSDIQEGGLKLGAAKRVSNISQSVIDKFGIHAGDLLFGMSGSIEKSILINHSCEALMNQRVGALRSHQDSGNFHAVIFQSDIVKNQILDLAAGGAQLNISAKQVESIQIPIPPLPEQKKIAEILSGIDNQRQALANKAANASMLRNALGEKIFSSLDGERVPLGELCNPKQWQTISTNQLTTSGYPVYGANGKIGYFTEYNHKEPVLAVTCRGATCGNLTLIPAFSYVTGNSMCLDNPREDTSPEYLFQFLSWRGLKDVISGSAQPQITRSPLQAVEVVLPSKERQNKIVSALESVNNAENIMNIALGRLDLLKQAIASDLLSGRKRVSI
jgi:type I restriction enzyme S subunit